MPRMTIRSLNTQNNRRIKLIKTATSVVDIGQQQGAVVNQSDYVGICLAPSSDILGCEGAVDHITVGTITDGGIINVYLNDQWLNTENIFFFRNGGASDLLRQAGIQVTPLTSTGLPATDSGEGRYYDAERARLVNTTPDYKKIRIELIDASSVDQNFTPENGSFEYNPQTNVTTFCLAPKTIPIGCAGATPTADTGGIWGSIIMRVNDVPYEGANSIPDLLYIDNHGEELHNTFKNLSDQYLRIHISSTELNQADHGWNENQNPTRTVDFNTGTIDFCLAPAGCEPTGFTMAENNLFEGGSVRFDYVINAPDHGINNVSKRFSMTDIAQGTWLSDITHQVIETIKADHLYISFRDGTGGQVANFDFWTYRSGITGEFYLNGAIDQISSDPITIKFISNGLADDLFPLIFPNAAADGITEYSVHSCGTMEWIGI